MRTKTILTPRETEILWGFALGGSAKSIAHKLHISHRTVEVHMQRARTKNHCRTTLQLVFLATREGGPLHGGPPSLYRHVT